MLRDFRNWIVQTLQIYRRTHALRDEMRSLAPGELEHIMRDLGMGPGDVDQLMAGHPGPTRLLPRRLQAMGLDSEYLQYAEPPLYRDLQATCSKCRSWCRCERDLARGDPEAGLRDYCLNAHTIDALVVDRQSK